MAYRRPGVYLEESLLVNPSDVASTTTVGCFVGVAQKGQLNEPVLIESWSDYVTLFGGFDPIQPPTTDPNDRTYSALLGSQFANLAALKADPTLGDGRYTGVAFNQGDFVTLSDDTQAYYLLPVPSTNRAATAPGNMFAADTDITASDAPNAAKLAATVAEVQTLTMTGTPTGGTFTLRLLTDRISGGIVTAPIAYNATSVIIKAAIDAALAGNTIAAAGGPLPGTPVTLTYTGYGDVSQAVVTTALTGGTTPTLTATTTTAGVGQGFVATPLTAWTAGQSMWVGAYAFYWTGSAWAAGTAGGGTASANSGVWTAGRYPGTPDAPTAPPLVLSYLPYSVYSFFQNGGRFCYIIRAAPTASGQAGLAATVAVNGAIMAVPNLTSFSIAARSVGTWGNSLKYGLVTQGTIDLGGGKLEDVFALQVLMRNTNGDYETVETFSGLSVTGNPAGSRRVDSAINDLYAGSRYIRITNLNTLQPQPAITTSDVALAGGVDPGVPDAAALRNSALRIGKVEGPINLNIVGYLNDVTKIDSSQVQNAWVSTTLPGTSFTDREDIMVINDSAPPRLPNQDSSAYSTTIQSTLGANLGDSYSASYAPWIIIPDPRRVGTTLVCPPGGAVMGMMARIDATIGVFRAPAGVIAGLSNSVGVQTKFTDSEMGDLNSRNINIVRSVVGAGICVMGGRTRKTYGADKYISARRTLISIKESLRQSTQWAVFENNDQRLWSGLRMTADRILRPMWEAGGLAGTTAAEAYYIRCDATINTPSVIQSGEVRMEVGVALEYPAEFVIIRITQFDRGSGSTNEISPTA